MRRHSHPFPLHLPVNFDKMEHPMYLLLDFLRIAMEESGEKAGKGNGE
jgi:hypothetical protein